MKILFLPSALLLSMAASLASADTSQSQAVKNVPSTVNPAGAGETLSSVPSAGTVSRTGSQNLVVRLQNSCFGTNLRSVTNPISPNGIVHAQIQLEAAGETIPIDVTYPGFVVANAGMTTSSVQPMDASNFSLPSGSSVALYGNTIQIEIPRTFKASLAVDGTQVRNIDKVHVTSSSFTQEMRDCSGGPVYGSWGYSTYNPAYPCGAYMGQSGPLSATIGPAVVSADNTQVQLDVAFPGQTGFCGGFWSPLMVFFDEDRPKFTGVSDFPLNSIGQTAWPEKGAPGAFLAIDRDGSGRIAKKENLFGDSESAVNGFEVLRDLDSNKDGWISAQDKDFKKLLLWFDRNGDGIAQKDELVRASKMIKKISLNYTKGHLRPIGLNAEERETSVVILKNKNKKVQIADIWLAPILKPSETLTQRAPAQTD